MDTKEILKKIKNNTFSTNELKKFGKDKKVIIAAVKIKSNKIIIKDYHNKNEAQYDYHFVNDWNNAKHHLQKFVSQFQFVLQKQLVINLRN